MEKIKLMNMCKIIDKTTNKVLVQERIKSWAGIAFPGGKVEPGENIVDSVKREVKEETGLEISDMKISGIKGWFEKDERYLILLFTAFNYSGKLIEETNEGKNYWIEEEKIKELKVADGFSELLYVFNSDKLNELTYIEENGNWNIVIQ